MKVLVIGATGRTGRQVLAKLVAAGHEVTALARNPDDLAGITHHFHAVKGDARDALSIEHAVAGQEAVISAFGSRTLKSGDLHETLMRNLVAAMRKHGVGRLVNLSAAGVGNSLGEMPLFFHIVIALLLRNAFRDKERGEAIMFASGLAYVNVRPGRLTDGRARGGVKASLRAAGLKLEMTREDLAGFMVAQLASDDWVGKSPIIGY